MASRSGVFISKSGVFISWSGSFMSREYLLFDWFRNVTAWHSGRNKGKSLETKTIED